MLKRFLAAATLLAAGTAMGQVSSATVDILDGADVGAPTPAGTIVVDGFVDVATTDVWTAAGLRVVTSNGATLIYGGADDPNTPADERLVAPNGADNAANRFITCVSKPRGRNNVGRFTLNAPGPGAAIAGRYSPTGPVDPSNATATEFNNAWFASPPENGGSASVDGYVFRVALNVAATGHPNSDFGAGTSVPAGATVVASAVTETGAAGWVNSSFDFAAPTGGNWFVWYVPEPASLALLALGGLAAIRRR